MRAQTLHRRRWHALDDGVLAYGLALLRTLWLWPLLHLAALGIFANGRDFLAPWLIFALLAGGTLAAQVAALLTGSQATHRTAPRTSTLGAVLVVLCGLAAILVAVYLGLGSGRAALALAQLPVALREQPGRAVATLALAGGLWWWGLLAGRETVAYDMLSRNFLIGLAGLLFVLGLNSSAQLIPRSALLALLLAYLATGLFLLALASIQATRRYERATGDHDLALPSHWWATVVTVVVTLLLAALILSWLFVPETFERLAAAVAAILALVGQLVAWLILALSYPLFMLLEWLARMVPAIPWDGRMPELLPPPGSTEQLRDLRGEGGAPIDPTAWWIGAGVLALAAIAFLFVLAVRHYRTAPDEDDVAETHEGILTVDLLKTQLSALLRRRRATSPAVAPYLPLAGDDPATRIRRTYQQLLKWAAGNGLARAPGMTPDHYRDLLASAYPAHSAGFATITAAYCLARYSPVPIPEAEVARVTAAWQQILAGTAVPGPNAKEMS